MKLIVNERDGYCQSIHIEYTPIEALVVNKAMRICVNNKEINEEDRIIMKRMLDVKPIFADVAERSDKNENG